MQIPTLVSLFDHPHLAADAFQEWGIKDVEQARQSLLELADSGLSLDLVAALCEQLAVQLPRTSNADDALAAFSRYLTSLRSPLAFAALLERDPTALPMLLSALLLGPRYSRLLVSDPEAFDLLRQTEGRSYDRTAIVEEVLAELAAPADERSIVIALARAKERHALRIAYAEFVRQEPTDSIMRQLAWLNDAIVEAAYRAAMRKEFDPRPTAVRASPTGISSVVIAMGRLGGEEMDYASPLKLLIAYEIAAPDAAALRAAQERFDRVARLLQKWLSAIGEITGGCPPHLMPLPSGSPHVIAHTAEDVVVGLESFGRSWHRQALLRARPVAGDLELGTAVLSRLESWLFRRYLSQADETGIKALKRRIQMEATLHQDDWRDPERARGGLANVESLVEFLQLLVGGDQPAARQHGMLAALAGLEEAEALTAEERGTIEATYAFLRRLEHALQILGLPSGQELPNDGRLVGQVAAMLGQPMSAADFSGQLQDRLAAAWQTTNKLLSPAFPEEANPPREVELLLDPQPAIEEIRAALAPFGFANPQETLAVLSDLAAENVPFLSTRRCRSLLASILPQLLCAVASTPDPDRTLDNLQRVSNSLGGKGVLWDLFRFHPPSLQLYVRLCAASPYLSDILTTNPGMLDELVDSLQLDRLPERRELDEKLADLCRGVTDAGPVLRDFKNAQHLRIGVRDILGKEDVDQTHRALADVAETCLAHVAEAEYEHLVARFGVPTLGPGPKEGQLCPFVILGLGKLGGREPNYHSNLDVAFLYQGEGTTRAPKGSRRIERTANNHFFTQLAQRFTKSLGELTPKGRLYTVDALLRPIGLGGALALSMADFERHFSSGAAPLWQWQVLCQARPVFGESSAQAEVARAIHSLLRERPISEGQRDELRKSRAQLEKGAQADNLKRGPGGTLDVEFLVQMLLLENAAALTASWTTNTQEALAALAAAGVLNGGGASRLSESYRFLRRVESALRLLNTSARHDLPTGSHGLSQLALLLGHSNPDKLREQFLAHMSENRRIFDRLLGRPES